MNIKKSIVLLLGINLIIYFKWLLPGIYTNGDWWYSTARFLHEYFSLPFTWSPIMGFGALDLTMWRYPYYFFYGVFSLIHFDTSTSDRILVFWPTIILGNLSIVYLVRKITKSTLGGVMGALLFNLNTYIFVVNTAFVLYSGAVWIIISLILLIHSLEKRKLVFSLLTALSLWIAGIYDFRMAYLGVFILGGYFLFYIVFLLKEKNIKLILDNFKFISVPIVLFALINIYWVLPLLFSKKLISNVILQRGLFGNEFLNILYSITLYHPFWAGNQIVAFNPQPIISYFWIVPVIAFLGLFMGRKNKNILFFGLLAFIGVFLTKQVGQPFSYIYEFLFQRFPGFSAFREATKFYLITALGFAVLIGSFVSNYSYQIKIMKQVWVRNILFLLVFAILTSNSLPFLFGEISMSKPYIRPNDYKILENYFFHQPGFFRHLWVPRASRWGSGNYNRTGLSEIDLITKDWAINFSQTGSYDQKTVAQVLTGSLSKQFSKKLLDESSIRYIIIPLQDTKLDEDFFIFYGKSREYYIKELDKLSYLRKVNIGTKDVVVYENPSYRPHIYTTSEKETIYKDVPYQKVSFTYVNPTKYDIQLKNVSKPFYINFTDSFNPNWEVRLGKFNWFDVLYKKSYFLPLNHFANDAGLNSFYINPKIVCSNSSDCIKNSDGSYSMNLTLYFKPQSYLYLGLIISGATLLGVLAALAFLGTKEIKKYGKKH